MTTPGPKLQLLLVAGAVVAGGALLCVGVVTILGVTFARATGALLGAGAGGASVRVRTTTCVTRFTRTGLVGTVR
jgi:hypothetical protein